MAEHGNIFFDLDGTILDVSEKNYSIYKEFMVVHELKYASKKAFWRRKRGRTNRDGVRFQDAELKEAYDRFFLERIEAEDYLRHDVPFPFALPILQLLKKQGKKIHIITMRQNRESLLAQMKSLRFSSEAKIMCAADARQADLRPFEVKARLLAPHVQRGDVIIGDTEADILCGKSLGLTTIAVLSGLSNYRVLKALSPDRIVRDIRSVQNMNL